MRAFRGEEAAEPASRKQKVVGQPASQPQIGKRQMWGQPKELGVKV